MPDEQEKSGLSRRDFARLGAAATLVTAGVGLSAAPASAASGYGEVTIRKAQVVTREENGQLLLVYIPDDRYVALDDSGRKLWKSMEGGTTSVSTLVTDHATRNKLTEPVAAFQVISFLDELRSQGYVTFELAGERSGAPLLDAQLALLGGDARRLLSVEKPDAGHTVADILKLANESLESSDVAGRGDLVVPIEKVSKAIVASSAKPDLSAIDVQALLADHDTEDVARKATVADPKGDTTLGDLAGGTAARVVVVVVIVWGPIIIIIVVVGPDGGTSAGKSRSACKTMCV